MKKIIFQDVTPFPPFGLNERWIFVALTALCLVGCEKARLDDEVRRLCAMDGGVKVYEIVKLPAEKFDKFGVVTIPSKDKAKPEDEYHYEWHIQHLKKGNPEMWRSHHQLIRRKDNKVLGESISYTRRGGDMPGPWHDSSFSCPDPGAQPSLGQLVFQN